MAIFNKYPYTSFQEMNLDWILQELKDLTDEWSQFAGQYTGITAEATTVPFSDGASVTVTGGDGQPFNFNFEIPAGKDLTIYATAVHYGVSDSISDQPTTWVPAPTIPAAGPGQYLWTRFTIQFSDGQQAQYFSVARQGSGSGGVSSVNGQLPDVNGAVTIPLPEASDNNPLMNGLVPSPGLSDDFSRADHIHPSDNTKLNVMLGTPGTSKVYTVEDASTETLTEITTSPTANAIPLYDTNGHLNAEEPATGYNVVNKNYLASNYPTLNYLASNYIDTNDIATVSTNGISRPDGTTIGISNGVLSALGNMQVTLLWTNPSPGTSYEAGTNVVLSNNASLNDYTFAIVYFQYYATNNASNREVFPVLFIPGTGTNTAFAQKQRNTFRTFSLSGDGTTFTFGACTYYPTYGSLDNPAVAPANITPYMVFGVR